MTELKHTFQGIVPGFEKQVKIEARPGKAVPVSADVLSGLKVQAAQRARYAAERAARAKPGLVKDTLAPAGTDTRFNWKLDPPGLEGPGGERKQG